MSDLIDRQSAIDTLKMDIDIIPFIRARQYVREALDTVWQRLEELPSARSGIDRRELFHTITAGIVATSTKDVYSCGMRNGMRWCRALLELRLTLMRNEPPKCFRLIGSEIGLQVGSLLALLTLS